MLRCTIGIIRAGIRYLTSPIWSKSFRKRKNKNVTYISITRKTHGLDVSAETYRQLLSWFRNFQAAPGGCRGAAFLRL